MSGRPYTYSRSMAIAQLMRDRRRPAIKEIEKKKAPYNIPSTVYLYKEDLFVSYQDTIDWVPKLHKLTRYGRQESYLTETQIHEETADSKIISWGDYEIEPIEGWPTEEEIASCIAESAELEKAGGSLSTNDFTAMKRLLGYNL